MDNKYPKRMNIKTVKTQYGEILKLGIPWKHAFPWNAPASRSQPAAFHCVFSAEQGAQAHKNQARFQSGNESRESRPHDHPPTLSTERGQFSFRAFLEVIITAPLLLSVAR